MRLSRLIGPSSVRSTSMLAPISFRRDLTPLPYISWVSLNADYEDETARLDDEADRAEYESNQDDE